MGCGGLAWGKSPGGACPRVASWAKRKRPATVAEELVLPANPPPPCQRDRKSGAEACAESAPGACPQMPSAASSLLQLGLQTLPVQGRLSGEVRVPVFWRPRGARSSGGHWRAGHLLWAGLGQPRRPRQGASRLPGQSWASLEPPPPRLPNSISGTWEEAGAAEATGFLHQQGPATS